MNYVVLADRSWLSAVFAESEPKWHLTTVLIFWSNSLEELSKWISRKFHLVRQ